MGWRETGLALILATSGCVTQETVKSTRIILPEHENVDYYELGVKHKELALQEKDEKKRQELIAYALSDFVASYHTGNRPYESLLHKADLLSLSGSIAQAFETIDSALAQKKTDGAWNVKGVICKRHDLTSMALDAFTNAIAITDSPVYRWNRYDANMQLALTPQGVRAEYLEAALTDAEKYVTFRADEPDGYAAVGFCHMITAVATKDADLLSKANKKFAEALKLIEDGKPLQRNVFTKAAVQDLYDKSLKEE